MPSRVIPRSVRILFAVICMCGVFGALLPLTPPLAAHSLYQPLPYSQDWSDTTLIDADNDWSNVPGMVGYRGNDLTSGSGTNPQTILADGGETDVQVLANQTDVAITNGGLAEFALANPLVAMQGSATAEAPHLLLHLNTRGYSSIQVRYTLRDIDTGDDNALQPIALHYRVGTSGDFTDVPQAYRADASNGPGLSRETLVDITLPAAVDNQAQVQLRFMTADAAGIDEWIGIDDIQVSGTQSGVDQPPSLIDSTPSPDAVGVDPAATLRLTFSESVDLDAAAVQLACPAGEPIALAGLPALNVTTLTLTPSTLPARGITCVVTLDPSAIRDTDGSADPLIGTTSFNYSVFGGCNDLIAQISAVQGSGEVSPCNGQQLTIEAVVVGDYEGMPGSPTLRGFYLQEESADQDSDPATSEGIFVFNGIGSDSVSLGDRVRVRGFVGEEAGQTQLMATEIEIRASGQTIAPTTAALPAPPAVNGVAYLERYEGMLVTFPQPLYVSEHFLLDRFGQLTLSAEGRLFQPTQLLAPGAAAIALQASNDRKRILLDDAAQSQNPDPILFGRNGDPLSAANTVHAGDTISGIVGVLTYTSGGESAGPPAYRMRPIAALGGDVPDIQPANQRPATPPDVAGSLKVASFNLLNYFNTISNCTAGVGGASVECRGADNLAEFDRQRQKTIAALVGLDADIIGVLELENDGYEADAAIQDLLRGLNEAIPGSDNDYTFVIADRVLGQNSLGSDAIKVGLFYRYNRVERLEDGAFVADDPIFERRPLVQVFAELGADGLPTGERFAVAVNHFKSKGSCPDAADPNADQGDGQGCWNLRRVAQANALLDFIDTDVLPSAVMDGDRDVLLIGDLNAYAAEDPIAILKAAGYVDLVARDTGNEAYSYVFDGQWGTLDYAFASPSLLRQVTAAAVWHINADEPDALDYNTDFRSASQQAALYAPDAYRSSDHDPLLVGLDLSPAPPNQAPTLSTVAPISGASVGQAFELSYAALAAAADEADPDGDPLRFRIEQILNGSLSKDGVAVEAGVTTVGPGESLVYTPASSGSAVEGFTIVASDGALVSTPPVVVRFVVTAEEPPPPPPTLILYLPLID